MARTLTQQLDDCLPQTQCGDCGFNGCLPYAESMANGESPINRCPPGGEQTIQDLAEVLNKPIIPLDAALRQHKPFMLANIDEDICIGCVKCIEACPVDAIIGSAKQMHVVLPDHCTGCELCLPPCPVDCIEMIQPTEQHRSCQWDDIDIKREDSVRYRERYQKRNSRLAKLAQAQEEQGRLKQQRIEKEKKQAYIKAAVERSKDRRKHLKY